MTSYFNRNLPGLVILVALLCFGLVVNAADVQSEENVPLSMFSHPQTAKRILPKAPNLLLLKHYEPGQNINGWLMSEKLDGVRAYWNGRQLLSRSGKSFAVPNWFIKNFPPFELDGELWLVYSVNYFVRSALTH